MSHQEIDLVRSHSAGLRSTARPIALPRRWANCQGRRVFCLLAAGLVGSAGLVAGDWPQWRGPQRDGISQESGWSSAWPKEGPKRLWQATIGWGYGTVSVSQGRLYVMSNAEGTDAVTCLDANSGAEVWKHSYACPTKIEPNGYPGPRCTPTVDGDRVYTVSREGQVFCLDAARGQVKWSKDSKQDFGGKVPTWGYSTSPLVERNLLIIEPGGTEASVVALDKETGKVVWQNGSDPAAYSSPIAFDGPGGRCIATLSALGVVGHSAKDGQELWRFPWKTSYDVNAATPVISGTKVFVSSGYGTGCAMVDVSAKPPQVLWKNKNMRNHANSCVLWQGNLYGFDESELKCLDAATGEVKWNEGKYRKGSLTLAGGKLIVYSNTGEVGIVEPSPAGYKELAFAKVLQVRQGYPPNLRPDTWAVPVLANGRLYCRSLEDLVCLDVK